MWVASLLGGCEGVYSCAYVNSISWRTPTTPLPMENQPRAVFERLFGDADDITLEARLARIREDRSILDSLADEVVSFRRTLPAADRTKVTQYLDAIHDIERRIQKAEAQSDRELPAMERPTGGIPDTFAEHARLMFDLQLIAFQSDLTRVISFMVSREFSSRTYPEIGVPDAHHPTSHHQNNPDRIAKLVKINTYHTSLLAYYLDKLQATPDGDSSLLDQMTMLYGGGLSDGQRHSAANLPILVMGGGGGRLTGGRHVRYPDPTPMSNLHVSLMDTLGLDVERFGTSSGALDLDTVATL